MSLPNSEGILAWDADAVAFTGLSVDVAITIDIDVTEVSSGWRNVITCNYTGTFTFARKSPYTSPPFVTIDDEDKVPDEFSVITGEEDDELASNSLKREVCRQVRARMFSDIGSLEMVGTTGDAPLSIDWEVYDEFAVLDDSGTWVPSTELVGTDALFLTCNQSSGLDVVAAADIDAGKPYRILTEGDTNWGAIGASTGLEGDIFYATGAGSGTGTATSLSESTNTAQWSAAFGFTYLPVSLPAFPAGVFDVFDTAEPDHMPPDAWLAAFPDFTSGAIGAAINVNPITLTPLAATITHTVPDTLGAGWTVATWDVEFSYAITTT